MASAQPGTFEESFITAALPAISPGAANRVKTSFWVGEALPAGIRRTRTVLDALSATNKSPFGTNRMERGLASPDATISTEKPDGTRALAPAGIGATSLKFGVDLPVGGRSRGVSRRLMPDLSCCHEPTAAFPLSSVPFPSSAAGEDAL